ncbi:HAD family hydrolase [Fusibacter ferrireducens]|uniref:HAD family phosphatase n=1 Tax=Fusibacter ferrireducens TaxID=2785058 RepID=A0ABR9ZT19_9FIRM|nr:HAD family phosphatase [Fusibacter ferrireducens]MBF4693587.1 HAD family phosphatase [Fusibacter ferrireducens]
MIKTVIFDMDGVIIDSERLFMAVEKEIFSEYKVPYIEAEVERFVGRTAFDFWSYFIDRYEFKDLSIEAAIDLHTKKYIQRLTHEEQMTTMPGVETWLSKFKERGLNLVLASSSRGEIIEIVLNRFKLKAYFQQFVSGDRVVHGKPNPEIFLKAAALCDTEPSECLVIEDSQNGIAAAKNAGMHCLGFQSGNQDHSKADLSIHEFSELNFNQITKTFYL